MKRSAPLKRTPFKRKEGPSTSRPEHPRATVAKPVKAPKERKCAAPNCEATFIPRRMEHVVCSPRCLMAKNKAAEKAERDSVKARKAAMKRLPDLIAEAQVEFNHFVRVRDAKKPCICCGKPLGDGAVGGGFDAGHYRSTGSAPHLRFNEDNCHAQRKHCNRYGAGRAVDYRIGLVSRIGLARVEALEADNAVRKWDREQLVALKAHYRAKRRELEKNKQ